MLASATTKRRRETIAAAVTAAHIVLQSAAEAPVDEDMSLAPEQKLTYARPRAKQGPALAQARFRNGA